MKRLYQESALFFVPAIILANSYWLIGCAALLAALSVYYFLGGRFPALNFDGKMPLRAAMVLFFGVTMGLFGNDERLWKTLFALASLVPLYLLFKPVERNEKVNEVR